MDDGDGDGSAYDSANLSVSKTKRVSQVEVMADADESLVSVAGVLSAGSRIGLKTMTASVPSIVSVVPIGTTTSTSQTVLPDNSNNDEDTEMGMDRGDERRKKKKKKRRIEDTSNL